MKTVVFQHSLTALCVLLSLLGASCEKSLMDDDDDNLESPEPAAAQSEESSLTIATRSGGAGSVSYPVTVYIMDSEGTCLRCETLASAADELSVRLASATYQVYAVGGATDAAYSLPTADEATADGEIALKEGMTHADLMTSKSTVRVGRSENNSLLLSFVRKVLKVASIEIADIPEGATAVAVSLAPLYNNVQLNGNYTAGSGDLSSTIALARQADGTTWKNTSTLNLLPSVGAVTITVKMTFGGVTTNYIYSTTQTLEANSELNISGRYTGDVGEFTLSGVFSGPAWGEPTNISFTFSENGAQGESGSGGGSSGSSTDDAAPALKSWYKNCYVFMSEDDDAGEFTTVTLLHRSEVDIDGAGKTADAIEAEIDAALPGFDDVGISGWRLPTEAEAKAIPFGAFNLSVESNAGARMSTSDYYYYKEAGELHSFVGSAMPRDCDKGQHLRPVATLRFKKQP